MFAADVTVCVTGAAALVTVFAAAVTACVTGAVTFVAAAGAAAAGWLAGADDGAGVLDDGVAELAALAAGFADGAGADAGAGAEPERGSMPERGMPERATRERVDAGADVDAGAAVDAGAVLGAAEDELAEAPGCPALVTAFVTGAVAEETAPVTELTVPLTPWTRDEGPDAEALAAAIRHTANAMMIAVTPRRRLRPNQCIEETVPRATKPISFAYVFGPMVLGNFLPRCRWNVR